MVITTVKDMIIDQYEPIVAAQSYTVLHCTYLPTKNTMLCTKAPSSLQLGESCPPKLVLIDVCLLQTVLW